ncbi:MAG: hypothetical protein OXI56_02625 [bacterium]|nr:hypothetical protein [bacterium]
MCEVVEDRHPTSAELTEEISKRLGVTKKAAGGKESFLRSAGVLRVEDGLCILSQEAKQWLENDRVDALVAVIHSRCRFIGEMIAELAEPLSTEETRSAAGRYGLRWATNTQIDNRRGWLQSSRLIEVTEGGRLVATTAGRALAASLELYRVGPINPGKVDHQKPQSFPKESLINAEGLAAEIEKASTDSKNPKRFELAVRAGFAFLGFDARQLGGAGKTDVLLNAPLGKGLAYRVTVDAKTVGAGNLGDHQVDWLTLKDHRMKHQADYAVLVGPEPSGVRLIERAEANEIAVLSASLLAGLCLQHAEAPLGLADYRSLFATLAGDGTWKRRGGKVDTSDLDEAASEGPRMRSVAAAIVKVLSDRCMIVGPLRARDLWLIMLERGELAEGSSKDEIQGLLDMLAHPLVRAVDGDAETGYVPSSKPDVTRMRLQLLTTSVAPEAVS